MTTMKLDAEGVERASRAFTRLGEQFRRVADALGASTGSAVKALKAYADLVSAVNAPPTAEDRAWARRANRALARSLRNQPAPSASALRVSARRCPGCGGPGVLVYDRMNGDEHEQDEVECGVCRGWGTVPRRGGLASASRKRRPHGRPR